MCELEGCGDWHFAEPGIYRNGNWAPFCIMVGLTFVFAAKYHVLGIERSS